MKQAETKRVKRAAIYLRVSTGAQATDGISLDAQERLDQEYAATHDFTVEDRHVYREAHTGGELRERARLMQLLVAARRGEFQTVIVDCLDRWVRDDAFDGWLDTELRMVGVRVVFATETYTDDLSGRVQRSLKSQFAQEERRKISQRCRKAYRERLQQGKGPAIGPAPYGYEPERAWAETNRGRVFKGTGNLVVHEGEAAVVRLIFRWVNEGMSLRGIARRLQKEGIPPPSASREKKYAIKSEAWGVPTLARLVHNPVYRGERAAAQQRSLAVEPEERLDRAQAGFSGRRKQVERPSEEWALLPAPALVSAAEWHRAQAQIAARAGIFTTRNTEASEKRVARPALLRGLIYCPTCQRRLHPLWREGDRLVYRCSSRARPDGWCGASSVDGAELEAWVKEQVEQFLQEPERVEREVERHAGLHGTDELEADLENQYRQQMAATRKQERLLSLFAGAAEGELPVALIQRQLADGERERQGLEAVIAGLEARRAQRQRSQAQVGQLINYVARLAKRLQQASFPDWCQVLNDLGVRVVARGGAEYDWRVEARFDPSLADEGVVLLGCCSYIQNAPFIYELGHRSATAVLGAATRAAVSPAPLPRSAGGSLRGSSPTPRSREAGRAGQQPAC